MLGGAARTAARGATSEYAAVVSGARRSRFATAADEAVFYSERTNGLGGEKVAYEYARHNGKKTIDMIKEERGIPLRDYDPTDQDIVMDWDRASAAFASNAQGHVTVILGEDLRAGNTWQRIEWPAILNNPNVTGISFVDPATCIVKATTRR